MSPAPLHPALQLFSATTAEWFSSTYGEPTAVQALTWPKISRGENLLASAPTGCGKTLAAFLWAIDRLQSGAWQRGGVRVLYVSPLKALNNDIHRNLLEPIEQLGADIRVATRSGDTSPAERQRVRKSPPDILITTPESLNVLLTSKGGRALFSDLSVVILDEIHAVANTKRGTHLMTAIERLVPLAGDFQRIALSATVRPIERVATWVAGHRVVQESPLVLEARPMATVQAPTDKKYELAVTGVPIRRDGDDASGSTDGEDPDTVWHNLANLALQRIEHNESTLIFGSGRRAVEKVTRFINSAAKSDTDVAYSHHGSLSKEVRNVVEDRLKAGKLKAIVATSSLELGIDIGALDEVIQVQTPFSIASLVQRMGRSGHGVGETSRALLVPLHERDVLGAMVIAKAALDGEIEQTVPLPGGLDVLAQVILSMTATESWGIDAAYATVRACDAYEDLSRERFEEVLEMLSGRYSNARIRSLDARLLWDKADGTLQAKRGVDRLVYGSGGTIPDRGYFQLRLADTKAKLGELDEEFVWERSLGDHFTLGTRSWQIEAISHSDVFVRHAKPGGAMIPFWRAEERDRGFLLAEKIGDFLGEAEALLTDGKRADLEALIRRRYPVQETAIEDVISLLSKQRSVCKASLPHRKHLLVEYFRDPHNNQERRQVILHTFWGGEVNRPFAMAIASAWNQNHGHPLEVMHTDDCVVLALQDGFSLDDLLRPVRSDNVHELLRRQLSTSGLFGARFRENAGCALLLPRGDFRRRLPLWLNRMRSKKLLAAVSQYENFPITLETWRGCLREAFDLENLSMLLDELQDREIAITETYTDTPSPFAKEVVWKHTNEEMYNDDRPEHARGSVPGDDWLREVALSSSLRPRIDPALSRELEQKLQRTFDGYAPRGVDELLSWLKERVIIPEAEWSALLAAMARDSEPCSLDIVAKKSRWLALPYGRARVADESLARLPVLARLGKPDEPGEPDKASEPNEPNEPNDEALRQFLREWLRFYGPRPIDTVARALGIAPSEFARLTQPLVEADECVVDRLHADTETNEVCDSQNLETLLRWTRSRQRKPFETLDITQLGLFWATHQAVVSDVVGSADQLDVVLTQLATYSAPAAQWETELLPARLRPYHTAWLDAVFAESDLLWRGMGEEKLTFVLPEDLPLLPLPDVSTKDDAAALLNEELLPLGAGRFRVDEMTRAGTRTRDEIAEALWQGSWAGLVTNDGFASIRQGSLRGFQGASASNPPASGPARGRGRRGRLGRRQNGPHAGAWFRLPAAEADADELDALDAIERNKERARILLDRYGVIFREVVQRESNGFAWRDVFAALRLMELSGEVVAGHFFSDIVGLQFASADAMQRLRRTPLADAIYWVSAVDPACVNGLGLGDRVGELPQRRPGGHVVYRGTEASIISVARGKHLTIRLALDAPDLGQYFDCFKVALTRGFAPRSGIEIETINEEPATRSPWRAVLADLFDLTATPKSLLLQRSYSERG